MGQNPLCDRCGENEERADRALAQADAAHRRANAAIVDMQNLEVDLRASRRQVTVLKKELAQRFAQDPLMSEATRIFDYWNTTCRDGRARAFTGKRMVNVMARLREGYTPTELCRAVDGAKRTAYVKDGHRYDDLELVCRDPTFVDRFIARAGVPDSLLVRLEAKVGRGTFSPALRATLYPCPICDEGSDQSWLPLVVVGDLERVLCKFCNADRAALVAHLEAR